MNAEPLRVWLEPGYDHGRFGAWLLDIPGAFTWARTRERATSAALSAAGLMREWLADHGDDAGLPPLQGMTIVEEVEPTWLDDGYERNATFAADHRGVTVSQLDAAIRRLGFARSDLLELVGRLEAHEQDHGRLPVVIPGAERKERSSRGVLRHLASSEVWLASRLDGQARYEGPLKDADPRDMFGPTRDWAIERLLALHARDPAIERTDGKGETWTLAKVLRRLVYHSLDHFLELERRLKRADGTADGIRIDGEPPPVDALVRLLRSVGWDPRAADPDALARGIAATPELAAAWDGERLVGFGRSLTDGALNAYLATILVDPRWQGLGIGERVVRALVDGRTGIRFALSAAPGMDAWYAKFGFVPDARGLTRPRR